MGYVKPATTTRYPLPSDPTTYWVELRDKLTYGDVKAASKGAVSTGPDGQPVIDNFMVSDNMMIAYIVGWNIDDDNLQILPITIDSLNKLDGVDVDFIANKMAATRTAAETEQKNS